MEIEVSRGALVSVLVSVLVLLFLLIGLAVSPRDGSGAPLVLSPSYLATQRYLDASRGWTEDLSRVDEDLVALLENQGNIYSQGQEAERVFTALLATSREVEQTEAPVSLSSLQSSLIETTKAYLQAARQGLVYAGAPTEENSRAVLKALKSARAQLDELERKTCPPEI